jgi:hypothetical protein
MKRFSYQDFFLPRSSMSSACSNLIVVQQVHAATNPSISKASFHKIKHLNVHKSMYGSHNLVNTHLEFKPLLLFGLVYGV